MTVSASIGPISGINYGQLITGLTSLDQQPIDDITTRLNTLDQQSNALIGLSALMTGLKVSAANFASSAIFRSATATAANPAIATATAAVGTGNGNYTFNVQRLASASQQVTQGFSSSTSALGLSGTVTLQLGGGEVDDAASLASLNGGNGVARGSIRITDGSGASTLVDLSHAVDINDVVNTLNSATGVNIAAKVQGDSLVVTDTSGGSGKLVIANAGGTSTASDLGLTTSSVNGVITGSSLTSLTASTSLDSLNDGLGVRTAGILSDFSITGGSGTVNVSLNGAKTINDVINDINTAGSSSGLTAALSADGEGLSITDSSGGPVTVGALNGSLAASDLGILGNSTGGTFTGDRIASGLEGPLLKDLNGGSEGQPGDVAPQYGTITINGQSIDLSSARTLNDVINDINTNNQGVTAAVNNAGNGITLTNSSGASFTVADGTGNLASFLKISGTSTSSSAGSVINSGNLDLRYISNNTSLSTLNGGSGISPGKISISGVNIGLQPATLTVDLSSAKTIGDVINDINNSGMAISARVNDTGDGILLTQTGGTGNMSVQDVNGGSTAKSLGIAGTFSNNQLDGSLQQSITIASTDSLSAIATKINNLGINAQATVINDGSGSNPFRLSITSRNAGVAGRVIFDGSGAGLSTTSLVDGQDAAVIFGGNANGTGGLLSTSSSNIVTGIVPGLTVTLNGVGSTTISVNRDDSQITTAVQTFVNSYNQVVNNIAQVTAFNANDQTQNGVLFGNSTVEQVQNALNQFVSQSYSGVGLYTNLASVGISIQQDGTLSLDTDTLSSALATNPDDVRSFFTTNIQANAGNINANPPILPTTAVEGVGATLSDVLDRFTDAQTGIIFQSTDSISTQEQELRDRQNELSALLTAKKNTLVQQFANLEVTIAQLQSQGNALSNFKPVAPTTTSSSSAA